MVKTVQSILSLILIGAVLAALCSCAYFAINVDPGDLNIDERDPKGEAPEDFSFSLVWGTYGISSYDSRTGKLVKTSDATDPSKYTTTLSLDKETVNGIYSLLVSLDLESYPSVYDPMNDPDSETQVASSPSQTIKLTVRSEELNKTVSCEGIAFAAGYDEKARDFLSAVAEIRDILTSTDEWKALPDYEFYYE